MPSIQEISESLRKSLGVDKLLHSVAPLLPLLSEVDVGTLDAVIRRLRCDDVAGATRELTKELPVTEPTASEEAVVDALLAIQRAAWNAQLMMELLVKLLALWVGRLSGGEEEKDYYST